MRFDLKPQEEEKEKEKEEKAKIKEPAIIQEDLALKEMTAPTAREAQDLAKAKSLDKHEEFCNISRALAVLASASVRSETHFLITPSSFFLAPYSTLRSPFNATTVGKHGAGGVLEPRQ